MGKSKPTKLADQPAENLKGTSPKPRLTQQSIRESFSLWTEEGQKTKDIERAIMQMICVDTLPLQTVEKAGFKNLLKVAYRNGNISNRGRIILELKFLVFSMSTRTGSRRS